MKCVGMASLKNKVAGKGEEAKIALSEEEKEEQGGKEESLETIGKRF